MSELSDIVKATLASLLRQIFSTKALLMDIKSLFLIHEVK